MEILELIAYGIVGTLIGLGFVIWENKHQKAKRRKRLLKSYGWFKH